jgi:hypothetical protein
VLYETVALEDKASVSVTVKTNELPSVVVTSVIMNEGEAFKNAGSIDILIFEQLAPRNRKRHRSQKRPFLEKTEYKHLVLVNIVLGVSVC